MLEGEERNENEAKLGSRDGVRSVKTAGTGRQAGLLGGGFCSSQEVGVDKFPGPRLAQEVG